MKSRITGTTMPVLEIGLEANDKIVSEPGRFSWMTPNVNLQTAAFSAGAKGLWGVLGRAVSGGGLFLNEYSSMGGQSMVAFAATVPGEIREVQITPGQSYMVHRHGFLCATEGVELTIGFQRSLGAGIFGGNGLILQKLSGTATAWVELGGEIVTYDLAPGEMLRVHPGHIGMFDASVNFDITLMPGIKNVLFGGDGLFIAQLTGPGKVWLQSLTVPNLAHAIGPYLGKEANNTGNQAQTAMAGAVAGSVLGSLFGRD